MFYNSVLYAFMFHALAFSTLCFIIPYFMFHALSFSTLCFIILCFMLSCFMLWHLAPYVL